MDDRRLEWRLHVTTTSTTAQPRAQLEDFLRTWVSSARLRWGMPVRTSGLYCFNKCGTSGSRAFTSRSVSVGSQSPSRQASNRSPQCTPQAARIHRYRGCFRNQRHHPHRSSPTGRCCSARSLRQFAARCNSTWSSPPLRKRTQVARGSRCL